MRQISGSQFDWFMVHIGSSQKPAHRSQLDEESCSLHTKSGLYFTALRLPQVSLLFSLLEPKYLTWLHPRVHF